jgi:c(7)-type cytochrome triheme protein
MIGSIKTLCRGLALMAITLAVEAWAADPVGDLVFERKGEKANMEAFPPSVFPHWVHRIRYRCDACHDRLFAMEAGSSEISMAQFKQGEACGACHDGKAAFDDSFENCSRCHRPPPE